VPDRSDVSQKISLPKIRFINLFGNQNLFDTFDFGDTRGFQFAGTALGTNKVDIDLSFLPAQTDHISLVGVKWTQRPVQPYKFVDLTGIVLVSIYIRGTLGDRLVLPNLKHLTLTDIRFAASRSVGSGITRVNTLFSDKIFLQASPVLETIVLERITIGDGFIEGLKSCTILKSLSLNQCDLQPFVTLFLESAQNSKFVPCLDTLRIIHVRPKALGMTFEEFRLQFAAKRPNVVLSDKPPLDESSEVPSDSDNGFSDDDDDDVW
jgi:hypothetical protein